MDTDVLRSRIDEGAQMTWVGEAGGEIYVRRHVHAVDLNIFKASCSISKVIRNLESDFDPSNTQEVSPRQYSLCRLASVMGVNISGQCAPGGFVKYNHPDKMCTLSYEIEIDISSNGPGDFALMDNPILSIACRCTCGLSIMFVTIQSPRVDKAGDVTIVSCNGSRDGLNASLKQSSFMCLTG